MDPFSFAQLLPFPDELTINSLGHALFSNVQNKRRKHVLTKLCQFSHSLTRLKHVGPTGNTLDWKPQRVGAGPLPRSGMLGTSFGTHSGTFSSLSSWSSVAESILRNRSW